MQARTRDGFARTVVVQGTRGCLGGCSPLGFQRSINFLSFKELLSWLIKNYQQLELFAVTAWSICNQRNQVHMHQPSCSPHLLVATARGRLAEFSSIQLAPRTPPSKPRVQWQSPPQGMVKINFDGATSARDQFLGIGVVFL